MNSKEKYLSLPLLQQELPVFFQPWWLDIVSPEWNIAIAETEGQIKAVWPYTLDRKWGFRLIRNPLLTPYLGPFFFYPDHGTPEEKTTLEAAAFDMLWQQLPRWDSLDLESTTDFDHEALFTRKGFTCIAKTTYETDLSGTEAQLLKALHSNHRNLIRQAETCHEIVEGSTFLPGLLQLHRETFTRKNKPYPFDPDKIRQLVAESERRASGKILAAKDEEGNITANIFVVWDRRKMYLLLSTVDTGKAHAGAVRLLIWQAIKAAHAMGLEVFDFEGSMDPGIAAFFRRFGGTAKTYLCCTRHRSLLWQWKRALLG